MYKVYIILFISFFSKTCLTQSWQDYLSKARKLYQEENFDEALKAYKLAKVKAPKEIDFSNEIAQTYYRKSNFTAAEKAFKQSKKKTKSDEFNALHNVGNSKMQQQDYESAINSYKAALKLDPNAHDTRYNLAQALRKLKKQNQSQDKKSQDKKSQDEKIQDQKSQDQKSQDQKKQESQLAKNNTERLLDELTKKEVETKKKLNSKKVQGTSSNSGKDW